ncbi:dephospho-CoA kinase [Kamptonema cortianum]|jgi:dephospho-CoA kinase|nr:dephospho-CoA kinase [Geitlerinema splendidum]MDK3155024.1 dephospho-CoA kinase [Kamptonema cortianum]
MWIIGITGGIGAGKSFLSKSFVSLGVPVHSSDKCIHLLLGHDVEIQKRIKTRWPKAFIKGKIDRKILGDLVLSSPSDLRNLEEILYPKLLKSQKEFLKRNQAQGKNVVALDIPLLFEVGLDRYCDFVVLASTPLFLRKKRVLERKGMTLKKFKTFDGEQMNDLQRRKKADFIIPCGREKGSAFKKVKYVLDLVSQKNARRWQGKWPTSVCKCL